MDAGGCDLRLAVLRKKRKSQLRQRNGFIANLDRKPSNNPRLLDLRVRLLWHEGQGNNTERPSGISGCEESREPSQPGHFDRSKCLVSQLSPHIQNRGWSDYCLSSESCRCALDRFFSKPSRSRNKIFMREEQRGHASGGIYFGKSRRYALACSKQRDVPWRSLLPLHSCAFLFA